MPILAMLECIHHQLMEWFAARRQLEKHTSTVLASGIAKELQQLLNDRACRYRIMESTPTLYEVQSIQSRKEHPIDLNKQTCRCHYWQIKGYPCAHALAVLLYLKSDAHDYVKLFYTIDAYHKTYKNAIIPPLNADFSEPLPPAIELEYGDDSDDSLSESDTVLPPKSQ